jgi:Ca2+-binding RTX toxin-like protein
LPPAGSDARRRHLVVAALALATVALPAARADAGGVVSCSFTAGTVNVTLSGGVNATLSRSGTAITLNGSTCDTATVLNTNLIAVTSPDSFGVLTLNLSAGPFAPGATDEGDGSSEIEITVSSPGQASHVSVIGSALPDHIVADDLAQTLNLNADETVRDDDVTMADLSAIVMIDTHEGDDTIESAHTSAHLIGGDGDDLFRIADDGGVQIDGVAGNDVASYALTSDPITLLGNGESSVVGNVDGLQYLSSIETVRATMFDDEMTVTGPMNVDALGGTDFIDADEGTIGVTGGTGFDILNFTQPTPITVRLQDRLGRSDGTRIRFAGVERVTGTEGDDLFIAGEHDYSLSGFGGVDTYSVANSHHGVRVDLDTGNVSNGDHLLEFEAVIGSGFADRILGTSLENVLAGRGGDDVIRGLAADDLIFGGNGDDHLDGGPGHDECDGGPGTDILVSC